MRKTCMNCSLITCHRYEQEVGYCDAHIPKQPVREPQCKTVADLHREWARVLDMCTAEGFDRPWECVKVLLGGIWLICGKGSVDLDFDQTPHCPPEHREFALAIIEGKPAFRGDVLYFLGELFIADEHSMQNVHSYSCMSWNPPKPKTISINGMDVPAHNGAAVVSFEGSGNTDWQAMVQFNSQSDANTFLAALEGKKP